jgi:galactose mutarotase-like enzyme
MPEKKMITLTDGAGASATIAPELGGWLLRYSRELPKHGVVEALHCTQAVIDRYPREMYAGNPVLFPLVSNNRVGDQEHHYEWNGRVHEMPQHGFARRSRWQVIAQASDALTMELTDNDSTRANYPFAFRQRLIYRLVQGRLHLEQVVENTGAELLPFSTGFHPYFPVPLTAKSEREACFVEIPEAKRMTPVGRYERFAPKAFPAQNWSVQEDVVDTLFLTDLKKPEVILVDPASELEIVFNFADAPQHRFLALWSKSPETPFYCIEPWTALPNSFSRLKDHELIVLEPQKTFRAALSLELRPMA